MQLLVGPDRHAAHAWHRMHACQRDRHWPWRGDAVDRAIRFVGRVLASAPGFGQGNGPMGHAMGRVPFYDLLAAVDEKGWDTAAFAARWK